MDEYADIYYVDSPRNADNRDHRIVVAGPNGVPRTVPAPVNTRTVYVQPSAQPTPYAAPYPYGPQYASPYGTPVSSLFGRVSSGQLIDLAAQAFAALWPLPASPATTGDAATDTDNSILYMGALAQAAKRDELVRTLGHIVGRMVR
jgi:hypothetical protein